MNITQMDAWPTDYERAVKEVERLRAEVKDLRARLAAARRYGRRGWAGDLAMVLAVLDLRRRRWRTPGGSRERPVLEC